MMNSDEWNFVCEFTRNDFLNERRAKDITTTTTGGVRSELLFASANGEVFIAEISSENENCLFCNKRYYHESSAAGKHYEGRKRSCRNAKPIPLFFFGRSFVVVLSHLKISARGSMMMRIKKEKQLKPQPQFSNNNFIVQQNVYIAI
jgi:hypothetical protein